MDGCGCDGEECQPRRHWLSLELFSGIDAFKGPLDVGNANGNFGVRLGVNGAVSVLQRLGVALQAGMAADLSNLKGSPYPFPNATIRDQIFTTVGMFQRINRDDGGAFTWGFAYDWLFDDYYANFHFGQWRVKGEYCAGCLQLDWHSGLGARTRLDGRLAVEHRRVSAGHIVQADHARQSLLDTYF